MKNCYVNVIGGIGNQLFQIAAGYAYAKKHDKKLIINPYKWCAGQGTNPLVYKDNIFKHFEYGNYLTGNVISIHEKRFNYDELPFHNGNVALNGYFQSLKYFKEYKNQFISLLNLPNISTKISESNNVAVHIRRGDYLKYPNLHYVCKTNYFKEQLSKFEGCQQNVFTDSVDYVLNEFSDCNFNIIKSNSELEDLTLMSKHENIICSNSSFSWWASLLGTPKNKIIVPDKWFHNFQPHEDIYRSEFIKVSV